MGVISGESDTWVRGLRRAVVTLGPAGVTHGVPDAMPVNGGGAFPLSGCDASHLPTGTPG